VSINRGEVIRRRMITLRRRVRPDEFRRGDTGEAGHGRPVNMLLRRRGAQR